MKPSHEAQAHFGMTGAPYSLDVYTLSDPEYDNITKFHVISHTHWDR